MALRAAALVAEIIDRIEDRSYGIGRPPLPTIEVETLRFFVREGGPWRELRAVAGRACGSTLRRRLDGWSGTAVLRQVHVALIRMVRSEPEAALWDVVVDSCSVRAKRGGELTAPNPTDRGKAGTKYHNVASTDGFPLAAVPSAANVHDTRLFPHLLRLTPYRLRRDRQASTPMQPTAAPTIAGSARARASSLSSARWASRTARGSARSAAWSSTTARGCWPTSGWTDATTGRAASSWPCYTPPASSSSLTGSARSENQT
jgi:hypothetical protein